MQRLILASTSSYRASLLSLLGYSFECYNPLVDESIYKDQFTHPQELAAHLAKLKATEVFNRHPNACVIGSDQVCFQGTRIFSKPDNKNKAIEQLLALQGKEHCLATAVHIISPEAEESFINITTLTMRPLSSGDIESYLDFDTPYDSSGSYKLESGGIKLFSKIDMTDHTAIIGLPLIELTTRLLRLGLPMTFKGK